MNIVKSIIKQMIPQSRNVIFTVETNVDEVIANYLEQKAIEEIVKRTAEAFAEHYAPEILKRIQDQTIDAKVIQKVISNLRKELMKK